MGVRELATKRQRGSSFHYTIKRVRLLPRPINLSFDDEAEGDRYVAQLEALLDRGIVPEEFLRRQHELRTVTDAVRAYLRAVHVPRSDQAILGVVMERRGRAALVDVTYPWCEAWIGEMKQVHQLAPSTIRHHVGALARALDWMVRKHPDVLPSNPLRLLPRRYASYSEQDARAAGQVRRDEERDRRLLPASGAGAAEEVRIRAVLAGEKPPGHQRPLELPWQGALECLFDLALESAMRLREMYTLDLSQVSLARRTVFLERTKNGDKRQVPLSTVAGAALERYMEQVLEGRRGMAGFDFGAGRLFPWWDGELATQAKTTSRLSRQFARVFAAAGCEGLRFHDLRHEATCRFFERTTLSDLQIATITGHKDPRILKRYANLRGSDLAERLW